MDSHNDLPRDRSTLGSQEYRNRLLTKLNCLVAVLEVAIAKIGRSLEAPGANEERLLKIRGNLENTLSICHRAKQTLEQNMSGTATETATKEPRSKGRDRSSMSYRDYVELSSIDEYQRFKGLPPIRPEDISGADFDDLLGKLGEL
jgi:hypothetical protein